MAGLFEVLANEQPEWTSSAEDSARSASASAAAAALSADSARADAATVASAATDMSAQVNQAKAWASQESTPVDGVLYSSKYYAESIAGDAASAKLDADRAQNAYQDMSVQVNQAKAWATQLTTEVVVGEGYSAQQYAINAEESATDAAASAASISHAVNDATAQANIATTQANRSKDWATKLNTPVEGTDYSSKYYANSAKAEAVSATSAKVSAEDSATAAAASATKTEGFVSTAITSATNASASATAAEASAVRANTASTTATSKATEASLSATNASNSANQALGYKNDASDSATNSAGSATLASSKATEASASATRAATSATSAEDSATAAAASATAASDAATTAATDAVTAATPMLDDKVNLARDWATKMVSEVVAGEGYSAKYWADQAAQSVSGVATFNGRAGTVVSEAGDYTPEFIGALKTTNNLSDLTNKPNAIANLGLAAVGIGNSNLTALTTFDWQTFDFTNGGRYWMNLNVMVNRPPGLVFGASSLDIFIEVTGSAGNIQEVRVVPATTDSSIYQVYSVRIAGGVGNRSFYVRSELSSAIAVTVAQGGTGASTADAARTNLGLGTVSTESVVPVAKGGTGATTAVAARTNLGLGSTSTEDVVPISKGGTGATTVAAAKTNLSLNLFGQVPSESTMHSPNRSIHLTANNNGTWGCWSNTNNRWQTLGLAQGGTGSGTAAGALANLGGVPTSRTINGKSLSANVSLVADDIPGAGGTSQTIADLTLVNGWRAAIGSEARVIKTGRLVNLCFAATKLSDMTEGELITTIPADMLPDYYPYYSRMTMLADTISGIGNFQANPCIKVDDQTGQVTTVGIDDAASNGQIFINCSWISDT